MHQEECGEILRTDWRGVTGEGHPTASFMMVVAHLVAVSVVLELDVSDFITRHDA